MCFLLADGQRKLRILISASLLKEICLEFHSIPLFYKLFAGFVQESVPINKAMQNAAD